MWKSPQDAFTRSAVFEGVDGLESEFRRPFQGLDVLSGEGVAVPTRAKMNRVEMS